MSCDKHEQHICICGLSPDSQEILKMAVAKFRAGALEHGPLDVMENDWLAHMMEEFVDQAFYALAEVLRIQKCRKREGIDLGVGGSD